MTDAISYKRFSSSVQAQGDSQRRQAYLTEEYCRLHGLRLIDAYFDLAVSGFNAANLTDGRALRALLDAAQAGEFRPGTQLIVESLDRLSRAEISVAVRLFLDILDAGLVIVTLVDGEQVFTKERVNNDMSAIVVAIVLLMRANNESRVKRERALQLHKTRREKARHSKIPMSKRGPPWLTVDGAGDSRRFVVDRKRAQVVERIFSLCVSGLGEHRICGYLNQRRVPTFTGAPKWRCYMIARLLRNRAVFGLIQPCLNVVENGKKSKVPDAEGPIENYFPTILSKDLFDQAQQARMCRCTRAAGKTPRHANLFTHLGRCAVCGAGLYLAQSADRFNYLRCTNGADWACSNRLGFPYRKLEAMFLVLDALLELVRRILMQQSPDWSPAVSDPPSEWSPLPHTSTKERKRFAGRNERDQSLARLQAAKVLMTSSTLPEAPHTRAILLSEVRRICEGVVLHPDRLVTLHLKPAAGFRTAFILGEDGLQGIQVKAPTGRVGFIGRAVCMGFVRPVKSGISRTGADKLPWQPRSLGEALQHIRIVNSPDGDWQADVHNPTQVLDVIARAETSLARRQ